MTGTARRLGAVALVLALGMVVLGRAGEVPSPLVNQGGGTLTIAITTDTLTWEGEGTTGSRTLADDGVATILKVTSTGWLISGGSSLT